MTNNEARRRAFALACDALESVRDGFVAETRLTFIARLPGDQEADILVTADELEELSKLIERSKAREHGSEEEKEP